jgi:hypothetical protein
MSGAHWIVRLFYNDEAKPPRRPGELAIETTHTTVSSMQMELTAAERRDDVDIFVTWVPR